MAQNNAVWGIEIGQAGLKAIRLRYAESAGKMVAVAFDYVPHPKILNQPDAIPDELIREALTTFLSRNTIGNDLISIGLPGHSALARFIQLPPVEKSKVAEIVKYEARQQIPFPLEDVIWDFQPLGSGTSEGDLMLDAEVGLFAMKRDQVMQQLKPFQEAKLEVEVIQIAPLALHNFLCFDQFGMKENKKAAEDGEEQEHEHVLILDMGTDNTSLMVSNGKNIWIRNVPLGGNHFTRALTKEMKLTFAKAEHLKCNATKAPDPRAVFQALKPVFNEYVSEIQKSIGFFASVNRDAKISRVLGVGNGFKLAGLQKFLQQNLQYPVERLESFKEMAGDAVLNAPLFKENILSFAVPYGLAIQAANQTQIKTTLLPPEIATERMIRRKKPWAVVTAAVLLFGLCLSTIGEANTNASVSEDRFGEAMKKRDALKKKVSDYTSQYNSKKGEFTGAHSQGEALIKGIKDDTWLEFYRVLTECFRVIDDENRFAPFDSPNPDDLHQSKKFRITSITSEWQPNLGTWFEGLDATAKTFLRDKDRESAPEGGGYVFTVIGWHTHHHPTNATYQRHENFINYTLLRNFQRWQMPGLDGKMYPVRQMGISHATVLETPHGKIRVAKKSKGPVKPSIDILTGQPVGSRGLPGEDMSREGLQPSFATEDPRSGGISASGGPVEYDLYNQTGFKLQFVWRQIPVEKRKPKDPDAGQTDE